tara:strand:- start:246 stop:602 length:357 start_codon:yes stop_codon:yes gene_type:complete
MARIAGTTEIHVDGAQIPLKGSITLSVDTTSRESVMGLDKRHGWKETQETPFVEVTVSLTDDLNLTMLQDITDATIQVQLANGKKAIIGKATQTNHVTVSPEEGEVTFRFEGETGTYA